MLRRAGWAHLVSGRDDLEPSGTSQDNHKLKMIRNFLKLRHSFVIIRRMSTEMKSIFCLFVISIMGLPLWIDLTTF